MEKNAHGVDGNSGIAAIRWSSSAEIAAVPAEQADEPALELPYSSRLVAMFDERSVGAEKFRVLASRLQYFRKQRSLKRVLITSTIKSEGKSLISANISVTLGRRYKTLLIDGDLRQPGLTNLLGSNGLRGLADWWREAEDVTPFLRRVGTPKLWHLPAGQAASQPLEIFQSQRMAEMLNQVGEMFEWVIIDSPPLLLADPNLLAGLADGTLLVVKEGKTPQRELRRSLESIENLKLVGIVMNGSSDAAHRYYGQYYKGIPRNAVAAPASKA
ncbi:MAG TPA: CpsD/CapB family tyrosine-protein kinase [Candidatus Angelobacter sp.]|nr:CpsD/CapB family tyrosine-protein kinase [Candidatus Angelobacter sp.]